MVTAEAIEGKSEDAANLPRISPLSKILVAFAGPAMNVIFAFAIAIFIYFVGLPVPVNPSVVGFVSPDSPEHKLGIRPGDRIVAVNGENTRTWQDVFQTCVLARTNVLPVTLEREGVRTTYPLTANDDNPLRLKMINLDSEEKVAVGEVQAKGPAEEAKLAPGDVIVSFAGVTVFAQKQLGDLVGKRGGQATQIVVERAGQRLALTVTPRILDANTQKARIGIAFARTPTWYEVQRPGPTPWAQVKDVWDKTWGTINALIHSKQTGVGISDLSGPPGILAMLAAYVNTDYRLALSFMVLLNINLAVINLLPIPVLDGGHIVLAIVERIRRRPLNVRLIEWTTTAFAVLLISFMLYVSFNDVFRRSFIWKAISQKDAQIEPAQKPASAPVPAPAK
jgi:regulator of sigma E protease